VVDAAEALKRPSPLQRARSRLYKPPADGSRTVARELSLGLFRIIDVGRGDADTADTKLACSSDRMGCELESAT